MSAGADIDALLQSLVEGTLTEEQAQFLLREWDRDPAQLQTAARCYEMHWILKSQASAQDLCTDVMRRLDEEDRTLEAAVMNRLRTVSGGNRSRPAQPEVGHVSRRVRRASSFFPWLALAATLAIVAGGLWWFSPGASLGLRVVEVSGEANIQQPRQEKVVVGMELRRGDRVVVPEGGMAVLKYEGEETTLTLHSGMATVGAGAGAKRVKLESGLLICGVAPQKRTFLLETAHGVAEVVGTRFSLGVNAAQTTLAVQEGRVDLHHNDQRLEVNAEETAVADAAGTRKLSPADAWITELLARAEAGSWDVVNLGTGVYSNDVWRMDARGGAAERRIWNMISGGNDLHHMVIFRDGKRWARGVVVGRMMILPESQAALEVVGAAPAANLAWRTYNYRVRGMPAAYQNLKTASVSLIFGPPGNEENYNCCILNTAEFAAGVWYRFAAYFDTETPAGLCSVHAAWPDENVATPQAAAWVSSGSKRRGNNKFEIGLEAKGVRMLTQGLKVVPLGADMPLPPKELLDRK